MTTTKRSWDMLSVERKRKVITDIINYFQCERDQTLGVIAAEEILDFMLQTIGADLYNTGIEDALNFLKKDFENLEMDMNALLKK